jgi:hypothetical protein
VITTTNRPTFRALATTVVPEAAQLAAHEWSELEAIIEQAVADRPARVQRQLALFLRALNAFARMRTARSFHKLEDAARARVLAALQDSPVLLLRRGMWGIRTLVLMGYYARPSAGHEIGYRADVRGWEARR